MSIIKCLLYNNARTYALEDLLVLVLITVTQGTVTQIIVGYTPQEPYIDNIVIDTYTNTG